MDDDVSLDDEDELTIRAKWVMDGALSLREAAGLLRAFADHLEVLEAEGWQLTGPVDDDWGFIRKAGASALS